MTFPSTVPVTAIPNLDGVAIPTGWVAEYRYDVDDLNAGVPEPFRSIDSVRLRMLWGLGWREFVTDLGQLGAQDPSLVADYYYQFIRLLELGWYARLGLVGSAAGYAFTLDGGTPLVQSWTCQLASWGGSAYLAGLSMDTVGGRSDPRNLALYGGSDYTCLQPGDVLVCNGIEAMVCTLPDLSGGGVVVGLHKPLYADVGETVTILRQSPTAWFPMPAYRAKWVEEIRTAWVPTGPIELTRSSGAPGVLAWPYRDDDPDPGYKGNFRAWGRLADGTVEEVTTTFLEGFPGLGSEPRLSIYTDEDGVTHTYVTPFDMTHTAFRFRYVMEAVSQSFPTTGNWRGCQSACKWVCRDWSNSIATAGTAGTKLTTGGQHWFCQQRTVLEGSFYLERFNEWCHQTECPSFAQRVPWQIGVGAMARVAQGRNLYLKGETGSQVVARAQNPSIYDMAGMPAYTGDGTKLEAVVWYAKGTPANTEGFFGLIEDTPTAEKAADDGHVHRLVYGAIKGEGAGVLGYGGAYSKPDRAGGKSPAEPLQYDDGSDYYAEEAFQPLREMHSGTMEESDYALVAEGRGDADVQRVRPNKVRIPGLTVGVGATVNGVVVEWPEDEGLKLTVPALWGKTFAAKTLSTQAATVAAAATADSGNVLMLQFLPETVTCEGLNAGGDAVQYTWLSAGGTVCAKNEERIYNPKATTQNKFGSMSAKVCRGDSIRFTDLTGLEDSLLTVIWAKAHAGSVYSGAGASTAPNGANIPTVYQTQAWRLAQDVVYLDLPAGSALRAYVETYGASALVGKSIEASNKSVFPPLRAAYDNGAVPGFTETGYAIQIEHFSQGVEQSQSTIVSGISAFDPANGIIQVSDSEVASWDAAATHHLNIMHYGGGTGCYLFHRGESLTAEHLTYLRTALRRLQWFQPDDVVVATMSEAISAYVPASGINEGGAFWATICTNGASRPVRAGGQVCKTWPSAVTGNNMAPYGGISGSIPSDGVYPIIEPSIPLSLFSEYNAAWDKMYFRSTGGDYQQGCPAGSGDVNGQWMFVRYFVWCNQVIELTPQYLGRFRAEWIGQALLEIKCSGAVVTRFTTTWTWNAETYGLESSVVEDTSARQVHLAAYVATEVTIPGLETPGYTFEKAGISVPFSLPTTNKWETVDVTALVRELCRKPYPAGQKLFLVVQAGAGIDVSGEYGARDLARSCFQSSVTIGDYSEANPYGYKESFLEWDGEKYVDGDGQVGNVVGGSQVFSHLSYEGFAARDLRLKLDWDAMEQEDYLPHRLLLADGGGNMPAMA